MTSNRSFMVLLCIGCSTVLAELFGEDNKLTKAIEACKNEPKYCKPYCLGLKLNYVTPTGEIILEKAPLYELGVKYGITAKCANSSKGTNNCVRLNSQIKCYQDETEKVMKKIGVECAKETNTPDADPGSANFVISIQYASHACYCRCVLKKLGLVDDNDNVKLIMLFKNVYVLKPEDVEPMIKDCAKQNNQRDVCTKFVNRITCAGFKITLKIGPAKLMKMKLALES